MHLGRREPPSIRPFFHDILTPPQLHSEVFMNLMHRCLYLIGINFPGILWFFGRFFVDHPGVCSGNRKKRGTLRGF
jgi:hypothetical protein